MPRAAVLLLLGCLVVAGCVESLEESLGDEAPEESVEDPFEWQNESGVTPTPTSPTVTTPSPTPSPTPPAPPVLTVSPTPPSPTPSTPTAPPPEPTPTPPPEPTPTPPPPSPTPPPPSPTPEPTPTPTPSPTPAPSWPQPGSFVRYRYEGGEGVPGYALTISTTITLRYDGSAWRGDCVGERREYVANGNPDGTDRYENTTIDQDVSFTPPMAPTTVAPGDTLDVPAISVCELTSKPVVVTGATTHSAPRHEGGVPVWHAEESEERSPYRADDVWWDMRVGLVVAYDYLGRSSGDRGWLEDTDAPLR